MNASGGLTAIKKRNLDVKTQMSQTVWLEPSSEKTVFIQVRNTSDKDMSNLQTLLAQDLRNKGYTVTSSPDAAYYWIQANVLKAEKMDLRTAQGLLGSGYEGAATGAALGAGITAYNSTSGGAILGVGLAAGLAGGRAVTVGDVAQLTSPESGEAFRLQQERSPADVAIMKEIVRQRSADLKSAVYSVIDIRPGCDGT